MRAQPTGTSGPPAVLRSFRPTDWPGAVLPWRAAQGPRAAEVWSAFDRWRLARLDWCDGAVWPSGGSEEFRQVRATLDRVAARLRLEAAQRPAGQLAGTEDLDDPAVDFDAQDGVTRGSSDGPWSWRTDDGAVEERPRRPTYRRRPWSPADEVDEPDVGEEAW